ncbi:MAG: hypothetical protein V3S07_05020 [Micropepsaceae bacterium]
MVSLIPLRFAILNLGLFAMLVIGASACAEENGGVTVEELRGLFEAELLVGAPSEEVEAFFERHDIGYSYDRFQNRYQAGISVTYSHSIMIYASLDDEMNYIEVDVHNSYIAP